MILTIISEHEQANKVIKQLEDSQDNAEKSTFPEKYEYPFWPQWYLTKSHSGMELWWNWV